MTEDQFDRCKDGARVYLGKSRVPVLLLKQGRIAAIKSTGPDATVYRVHVVTGPDHASCIRDLYLTKK